MGHVRLGLGVLKSGGLSLGGNIGEGILKLKEVLPDYSYSEIKSIQSIEHKNAQKNIRIRYS